MQTWRSAVLAAILCAACLMAGEPPAMVTIESNVPTPPPGWAALERRLLDEMSEAAVRFTERYIRSGGTLIWKTSGTASPDDLPETFYNLPLLYLLGGDERLKDLAFRQWNATVRQLTYDFPLYEREFPKHADWFHISECWTYFYFLGMADPTDHETVARARRFAAFYTGEDKEAPNYDAKLKIIRSPHTGSRGPLFGETTNADLYGWSKGMAMYGLPLENVPGVEKFNDLKSPENARRMGQAMAARMYRGDVPVNLAATALVANAYLLTGERKYAGWVKEYAGAWLDRTRANGGLAPDNIGLSGKVGEYHDGKWWGGYYGWRWPHGYYNIWMGLQVGAASAALVSGGDLSYLDLARTTLDRIVGLGKDLNGTFVVPYKHNDKGWFAWQPIDRQALASLWFLSQDGRDWDRIEKVRLATKRDWHEAAGSRYPNDGYATLPSPREDCWNCDVEGLSDWRRVADIRNKEDRSHEGPWLRFIAGDNPDYPEKILRLSYGQMSRRLDQIRKNVLLLEYDPRGTTKIDPADIDLRKVHEHHWQMVNPVTTEALVQLTLGAPQIIYNGGLLHASVRHFDPARKRPGLPRDVAALVTAVKPDGVTLELVNLSPFETREVIVQAGAFGEHQFTTVRYQKRMDPDPLQPFHSALPAPVIEPAGVAVNRKFFAVRLPPGTGQKLEIGMRRFANQPGYAFPWHGERAEVR
jgi:hypothetical protein